MMALSLIFVCALGFYICHALEQVYDVTNKKNYVYWSNATVPFYIDSRHFDRDQAISIMTSLSVFSFKTCLKFLPVMAKPQGADHVLVLQNPGGLQQCRWSLEGHSIEGPHAVNLGYQCLKSPQIEMTIMKALGFPFEHNRASRDLFIDVQYENIEPDAINLFAKDSKLPVELRNLPYDVNSAMHFGDRDFSKNGHRTIIIKDRKVKQNRIGLSDIDIRKIQIVYGPECQKRDRQEKIDLCQIYPGVARKKREADLGQIKNLRVNRDITPPPNKNLTEDVVNMLQELGIGNEVEGIIDSIYKTAAVAVKNAKKRYCNANKEILRTTNPVEANLTIAAPTIHNIIQAIAKFSQSFVDISVANITVFCDAADDLEAYQRIFCQSNGRDPRCPSYFKSTKSGPVIHYTQHRPTYFQSTKHTGKDVKYQYERSGNNTDDVKIEDKNETATARRKREAHRESKEDRLPFEVKNKAARRKREAHRESKEDRLPFEVKNKAAIRKREAHRESKEDRLPFEVKNKGYTPSIVKKNTSGDLNQHKSKASLRSATSVSIKKEHFAPFRKSDRRFRIYSRKDKTNRYRISKYQQIMKERSEDSSESFGDSDDEESTEQQVRPIKKKKFISATNQRKLQIPQTVPLLKGNKEFYADRKWPDGVVRYVITEYGVYNTADIRARIKEVNDILIKKTCVRLEELDGTTAKKYKDYLVLDVSPDYVTGRVGGRQRVVPFVVSLILLKEDKDIHVDYLSNLKFIHKGK